jgi:hypothetical protein
MCWIGEIDWCGPKRSFMRPSRRVFDSGGPGLHHDARGEPLRPLRRRLAESVVCNIIIEAENSEDSAGGFVYSRQIITLASHSQATLVLRNRLHKSWHWLCSTYWYLTYFQYHVTYGPDLRQAVSSRRSR